MTWRQTNVVGPVVELLSELQVSEWLIDVEHNACFAPHKMAALPPTTTNAT